MPVEIIAKSNASELIQYFGAVYEDAAPAARESINAGAELLQEEVIRKLSVPGNGVPSEPGEAPREQTGGYVQTIQMTPATSNFDLTACVGTDDERANRLEWGFYGIDSLGRYYEQKPRPAWGPTIDEVQPLVGDDLFDNVLFRSFNGASFDNGNDRSVLA